MQGLQRLGQGGDLPVRLFAFLYGFYYSNIDRSKEPRPAGLAVQ